MEVIVAILLFLAIGIGGLSLAPWVPTRRRDIGRVMRIAGLTPGQTFYDLGCGDGRVAAAAGRQSARAIGLEMSVMMYLVCLARKALGSRAEYRLANAMTTDLSDADVVYVYGLFSTLKDMLKPKLERELKPGAKVISYAFRIEGWTPAVIDRPGRARDLPIYLYIR